MSARAVRRRTPMPPPLPVRKRLDRRLMLISALVALKFAVVVCMAVWAIWPGWMTLVAPLVCPQAFPDPFVLEHSMTLPGVSQTTWGLVCMSKNGALFHVESALPMLLAVGVLWLPGMALALPAVDWVRRH